MSSSVIVEIPRRRLARITGGLYLAFILAMALADVFGHIGIGDVELAYQALTTDSSQFAAGLAFGLLSAFLFVMAAWGLYVLLRPVNRDLALLFLLLNAIGVAIQVASYLPLIFGMLSTDASGFKGAFSLAQIEGLQFLSLDLHKVGFATAQLFATAFTADGRTSSAVAQAAVETVSQSLGVADPPGWNEVYRFEGVARRPA